uniref:Uncharacterized protein n=1 Tax=Suricata suricatta TaxID=37032 RepID=A0A673THH8_SURSU
MQAWALTQGASGEGHRTHGRNIQKDEPSSPKNAHALSSSSGCTEAKLAFLEDDWDQRADGPEVGRADRVGFLEPSCPGSLDASREGAHSQSSEFEDSADSAFLNETYSIHYCESERKNESLPHSPSELGCEVQSTTGACFDVLDHHSKKVIGWERACEISDDGYGETAGAAQQRELDEDSQQEYHSAEEQEDTSAPVPPDQTRTSHTPDLGVVGSRNSGHEVESACCLDGSQVKLASESTIFLDSADVYGQEDAPRGSKFQGSVVVREYHEPEQEVCKEQETSLMYHTAFDDLVLGSSPFENQGSRSRSSFVNPQKALEAKMYTGKVKCQRIESKAFCRHEVVEKDVSHHLGNPSTLRQDRALQMSLQPRKDGRPPWTPVFDESVISACGCSHYINLQSTLRPASGLSAPAPSTAVRAPEAVGDPSLKASAGGTASDTSVRSPELAMRAAGTTVTVAQTVDVCSDFRARFTTSRATSARPSVVSTSTNTDIIAADRRRPGDWQGAGRRSVACNTEGPHGREPGRAPVPRSRGPPGSPLSGGHSQPRGDFHSEVKPV